MSIGERLKYFGVNKYGSVKKFADALEWHSSNLYDYFNDNSMPGAPMLIKLIEMGCNIEWLLVGDRGSGMVKEPTIPYEASELKRLREENKELKTKLEQISKLLNKE